MKTKPQYITAILGLALLSSTMGIPQVLATSNTWYASAVQVFTTSPNELASHLGVPPLPSTSAEPDTILWIGGDSNNVSYLDQPELRAISSTSHWTGVFEVYNYNTNNYAEPQVVTNVLPNPTDTVILDVYLTGAGWSCQTVTDTTTSATASHCFSANNYGTTFANASAEARELLQYRFVFPSDGWHDQLH